VYEQALSRRNPGCIIFLIDRSDSMKSPWAGTGMTMAQGAALAINRILLELCIMSTKEAGGAMRSYFYIGCYGYGLCPSHGGEGVESALPGGLAVRGIVPLPELAANPIAIRDELSVDPTQGSSRAPKWVAAHHGWRTPMCEAFALVGAHIYEWAAAFTASFPPIICHLTDGMVTDSPYEGADLAEWASRLTSIRTSDGPALLLNIFLSPSTARVVSYPASADGLPDPGPALFAISSPLPGPMIINARAANIPVAEGARGFVFNADLSSLLSFLEIGTRISVRDV
jgi:hypothetical protein